MKVLAVHSVSTTTKSAPLVCAKNSEKEQALLNLLAKGERAAFWELWNIHQNYLYARCLIWMGGNTFDAEEALSLATLKAWKKLPTYARKITNLRGWLNRFTHNLCVDLHRQKQRDSVGIDNIEEAQYSLPLFVHTEADNPEAVLLQKELTDYLYHCIETLPIRLRQPLILRYYENMSCIQIGNALSVKANTISKRLQEAKVLLKKHLSQYSSGLSTSTIQDALWQPAGRDSDEEWESTSSQQNKNFEKINYKSTITCLENLSLNWLNSPQSLM
ncbi:MAG: RNA polymerase sigma factor [Phormidesmis sp.]